MCTEPLQQQLALCQADTEVVQSDLEGCHQTAAHAQSTFDAYLGELDVCRAQVFNQTREDLVVVWLWGCGAVGLRDGRTALCAWVASVWGHVWAGRWGGWVRSHP